MESRTPCRRQATENILTFVTTFNPNNPSIISQLQTNLTILKSSPKVRSVWEGTKIINSRRQPSNLKQLLVNSKFINRTEGIVSKCGGKRCTTYEQLIVGNSYHFKSSNYSFKMKHDMDCSSKFVLYVLTCAGCGENYIGETKIKLRERMTLHWQHIRDSKYRTLPASAHVAQRAQNKEIKFTVFPFYKITTEDDDRRRAKEEYLIKKFKPALNSN